MSKRPLPSDSILQVGAFTAGQLARGLGKTKRAVLYALGGITPTHTVFVNGQATNAWALAALPASMVQELEARRIAGHFRTKEALLANPSHRYQSPIPIADLHPDCIGYAHKLQRALAASLSRLNDPNLSGAEFEARGVQDYFTVFGKTISTRYFRKLLKRVMERDAGAEDWENLPLYLPETPKRRSTPVDTVLTSMPEEFLELKETISSFRDPSRPTPEETACLWNQAVEIYERLAEESPNPKKIKRAALDFLWLAAGFLADSPNALRVAFDRRLKDTAKCLDGRHQKFGEQRADAIPQEDMDILVHRSTWLCGGRAAQAIRECAGMKERSGLSEQTLKLAANTNRRLLDAVVQETRLIAPYILGKKAIDDATASLRRSYKNLRPMTAVTADDYTLGVYAFVPDGQGWYTLTRGQCILFIDCRTLKILGRSLQPERNYDSLVIRTLDNRVMQQWGVPRVKLYERGIWANAKVIKNAAPIGPGWEEAHSQPEHDFGWRQLGVRIIHATRARTKPAELVGGLLQNLTERIRGYCGRDERHDCPEVTRKNKLAVEAKRVEPHGLFLSFEEWTRELDCLIEQYNTTRQNGFILDGASPDELFESLWPHDDPPTPFNGAHWHLLAHWVSRRTVGTEGISFRIGKELFVYRDANTAALRGQEILAWFDPGCPQLIGVTDLKHRNPVLVERRQDVDFLAALDPDGESGKTYRQEVAKVAAHSSYATARFRVLRNKFEPTFRQVAVAPGIAGVGEEFRKQREQLETKKRAESSRLRSIRSRARQQNINPALATNDDSTQEGLDLMRQAQRESEKESANQNQSGENE